jgi:phage terminase Nu1 subunit (DNA packaging protein)
MAQILGITGPQLNRLVDEGAIEPTGTHDAWDVIATTTSYRRHLEQANDEGGIKSEELQLVRAQRMKVDAERHGQELKNAFDAKRLEIVERELAALETGDPAG